MIVFGLALAAITPTIDPPEQVWRRCLNARLLTRLRFEDEHNLASEPPALASWAFVECGVEFDLFARGAGPSMIKKALRRGAARLRRHGQNGPPRAQLARYLMLYIDNFHATAAGKPILDGLSLTINAGEIHATMRPNGAGKSTLAGEGER